MYFRDYATRDLNSDASAPGLCVEPGLRVRVGLRADIADEDMLVIGLAMCLRQPAWRDRLIEKVRAELEAVPADERAAKAAAMLAGK